MTVRALLGLVCLCTLVSAAAAEEYDPGNRDWNGLSTLQSLAQGLSIDVVRSSELDWMELGPSDALWLLSPQKRVDIAQMTQFLQGGGTLVLGDDFGTGEELLARLGFLRKSERPDADSYEGLGFARIAHPFAKHPLSEGVAELITNHAAVFTPVPGYELIFGFNAKQGLVSVGPVGRGTLIVLSDPSVLINRMLEFEGNLRFAQNLLAYSTKDGQSRRIQILTGDVAFRGEVEPLIEAPTPSDKVRAFLLGFNHFLEEWNDYVLTNAGIYTVAGLLILALSWVALRALPLRARVPEPQSFLQLPTAEPTSQREIALQAIATSGKRANFAIPAQALRQAIDSALARVLVVEHPLETFTALELGGLLEREFGADATRAFRRLGPFIDRASEPEVTWEQFSRGKREVEDFLRAIER